MAVLPADRRLQQPGLEAVPALDALQDQEIRAAGGDLDVGRADHRPAIEMRRDLGVMRLGHAGNFFRLQQSADPAEIHLQDGSGAGFQHPGEFVFGAESLAGGDRDPGLACHLGHLLGHFRRHRLLEPERIIGLETPCEADGAGGGELAVGAEEQIAARAHRLADPPAEQARTLHRLQAGLARIEGGIGAGGVELNGSKALFNILKRALGGGIRVAVDLGRRVGVLAPVEIGIEIGIAAQPLVHLAAEKLVDRLPEGLAQDVPERHLDP